MFERYEAEMADFLGTPPEIEPADLVDELDAVLARITREEAKAAEILARVIETEAYRRDGHSSATAMLQHRNSMHPNAASQIVARANNLTNAPLVSLAYSQGAISTLRSIHFSTPTRPRLRRSLRRRHVWWRWPWTLPSSRSSGNGSITGWNA